MEVTWHGILLFPLGMLLLVAAPRWLHAITVFSIPFTTTSLLNTASGVPVTPVLYLGSLFIASQVIVRLAGRRIGMGMGGDRSLPLLFLFLGVVVLSMIMPLIIDGNLLVSSNQLNDLFYTPVKLTENNIKNSFPVIFFVILSMLWIFKNNAPEQVKSTIKIYVLSAVFVSLWGGYQFLCNSVLGIEYPYYIFNNTVLDTMKGYKQLIEINGVEVSRVSSFMHEPSILSKYLLTVIPIMVVSVLMKQPLFSRGWDKMVLAILLFALAITTSSIAYFGVVIMMVATLVLLSRFHSAGWEWVVLVAVAGIIAGLAFFLFPMFQEVINSMIFMKSESGSALERYLSVTTSWEYFLDYPILGIGWAMVTSHDLLVYLLACTGVVGVVTFVMLLFYVIRRSLRTLNRCALDCSGQHKDMFVLVAGLTISLVTLIINGLLTGLEFYLGYFYFIMSMLIASNVVVAKNTSRASQKSSHHCTGKVIYQPRAIVEANFPLLK